MRVKLAPEAAEEMLDTAAWYDRREAGLGQKFITACDESFEHILHDPERHLNVGKGFRRYLMPRFPFVVYYEVKGDVLIVWAVFHGARNPDGWRQRLGLD
jgi:toxin ParE1/3/4